MTAVTAPEHLWNGEGEAAISVWYADDGVQVEAGQALCEVMFEKAAMEVVAPVSGVLTRLKQVEEPIGRGEPLARIS